MITEANIKWVLTWVALAPLIVLSWASHMLWLPVKLVRKIFK